MEYRVMFIQNTYFAIFYLVEGRFSPLWWWYSSVRSRRVETTTTSNKAGGEGQGVAAWFMWKGWGLLACREHKSIISTGVVSLSLCLSLSHLSLSLLSTTGDFACFLAEGYDARGHFDFV